MLDDFTYRVIPFPASLEQRQIPLRTYVTEVLKVIRKSDVALSAPDLQDNSRLAVCVNAPFGTHWTRSRSTS